MGYEALTQVWDPEDSKQPRRQLVQNDTTPVSHPIGRGSKIQNDLCLGVETELLPPRCIYLPAWQDEDALRRKKQEWRRRQMAARQIQNLARVREAKKEKARRQQIQNEREKRNK